MNTPILLEHWYRTADWLLDKCDRFPKQTRFTIAGRIALLSIETLELITEAAYSNKKREVLLRVNLSFQKIRILLRLSFERQYLNITQYEYIQREINEAGKMCGGWIKSCKE
ncbi:MAG: diversity-generating retroelement protein Avd [Bacteroidota bacterium]